MKSIERAAYLKGLVEGSGMDTKTGEGKLWSVLSDLLSDLATEVNDIHERLDENDDYIDALDAAIGELEEINMSILASLEDMEDEYDDDFEDFDDDGSAPITDISGYFNDFDPIEADETDDSYDLDDDVFSAMLENIMNDEEFESSAVDYDGVIYDVECPSCGHEISLDESMLAKGAMQCPFCGEILEFDIED